MKVSRVGLRIGMLVAPLVLAGAMSATALAEDTVTGEVIDMSCYLKHPETGHGVSHKKCAETCAKKGLPMGLLTEDKQVWLLLEDHDNPKAYATALEQAAKTISVEGTKVNQGGVNGLVVEAVK